jgi:hypothetical protein
MAFTYNNLIAQAKQQKSGLMGIHLPMLSMHFTEFVHETRLNDDDYPSIELYIKKASYQEKREIFEVLGFKVLYMTLSGIKVIHFAEGQAYGAPTNPSIDQAFLDNKRNVFIIDVKEGTTNLYFILEYQSDDALADYTVDREALAEEQATRERIRAIFGRKKD